MIALKDYQNRVLDSLREFFRLCSKTGSPAEAFGAVCKTNGSGDGLYLPIPAAGLARDMPYVCLRVPTGGGTPEAVTGASASEFVLAGGNLYFRDAAQGGIYRCSTSGGSATRLTTVDGAKLNVSGSTLYFVNYADGSSHYTMSTSGGNLTKLGT